MHTIYRPPVAFNPLILLNPATGLADIILVLELPRLYPPPPPTHRPVSSIIRRNIILTSPRRRTQQRCLVFLNCLPAFIRYSLFSLIQPHRFPISDFQRERSYQTLTTQLIDCLVQERTEYSHTPACGVKRQTSTESKESDNLDPTIRLAVVGGESLSKPSHSSTVRRWNNPLARPKLGPRHSKFRPHHTPPT